MKNYNEIMKLHREFLHTIPEISYNEIETSQYIYSILAKFPNFQIHKFAKTGLVAEYKPLKNKNYIGFRADIDALAIVEKTDLKFASQKEGFMHACGHDIHMACLLGVAEYINDVKPQKNIILIFQPAEEGGGGALKMIEEGLFEKFEVSEIYALHNTTEFSLGTIALNKAKMFAGTLEFKINLKGMGGHAAYYHKLNDLNLAGSYITTFLNIIPSRFINPNHETVVSIGSIGGIGTKAANILPGEFGIKGTVRSFYLEDLKYIKKKINDIINGVATIFGIDVSLEIISEYLPVINNPEIADKVIKLAENLPQIDFLECEQQMTGEDFGFMTDKIPGALFWLGAGNETNKQYGLHNAKYSPDDKSLEYGFEIFKNLL